MKKIKLLIINPGSTSTKIAVFEDENLIFKDTLYHSVKELSKFTYIYDQYQFRKDIILKVLRENEIDIKFLNGIVGRGGLLKPIEGGTYKVNEKMLQDLKIGIQGEHASNLGGILAYEIAKEIGVNSYIVDPVVVDEMQDVARISGMKEIQRKSKFHALNQKAIAKHHAKNIGKSYEDLNLIVVHLGGGISVGAHEKGRVIDVTNALDGEGCFSPERTGGLPVGDLIKLCYSGKYTYEEIKRMIIGNGGMTSYLNTNDAREVVDRIKHGDKYAQYIYYSMAYQVSKEIGSYSTVLKGDIDGIILTGGIAYDELFTSWIKERVSFISDVFIYPGEDELLALAEAGLRILKGEEEAKVYD